MLFGKLASLAEWIALEKIQLVNTCILNASSGSNDFGLPEIFRELEQIVYPLTYKRYSIVYRLTYKKCLIPWNNSDLSEEFNSTEVMMMVITKQYDKLEIVKWINV